MIQKINFIKQNVENESETQMNINDNGNEIREFYENVISLPSNNGDTERNGNVRNDYDIISKRFERHKQKQFSKVLNKNDIFKYCQNGDYHMCNKWIQINYDVNLRDNYGWTPLMSASCGGHYNIVKLLLENGADHRISDKRGMNALQMATKNNHYKCIELLIKFTKRKNMVIRDDCTDKSIDSEDNDSSKCTNNDSYSYCHICKQKYSSLIKHYCSVVHQINTIDCHSRTNYVLSKDNRGFKMMLNEGWDWERGLGPDGDGRKYPVKTVLKRDRLGFGHKFKDKPKISHFGPFDESSVQSYDRVLSKSEINTHINKRQRKEQKLEIEYRRSFY